MSVGECCHVYVACDEQQSTKLLMAALFTVYMQEQYVFIHDAVLEYLICGNTQIPTPDLNEALHCLQQCDECKQSTGFGIQFQVSKPSLHVHFKFIIVWMLTLTILIY